MDTCVKCGMPVSDDSKCSCDTSLCFHCCACGPDCSCGCSNMIDDSNADDEEDVGGVDGDEKKEEEEDENTDDEE
ncbi:MAG: hypothetical protein WC668_02835 [Patescibacteria group bacterium]